jgi:hypothetical protein
MVISLKKVIIVGAGVSGLTSAIILKRRGFDVLVLEKNQKALKKALITGSGKCNYFNSSFNSSYFTSNNIQMLDNIINDENILKVNEFFNSIGLIPKIKNGYYYPLSMQAIAVSNSLLTEVKNLNIPIIYDSVVKNITYDNEFILNVNDKIYKADKVIIATGSKAYYETEAIDYILESLKKLGHHIIPIYPGLVGLKAKGNYFNMWVGTRVSAKLSLFINDEFIKETKGELQLTDYGVSGICAMILSNKITPKLKTNNIEITINFLDSLNINTKEEALNFLEKRNNTLLNRTISELFDSILPYKLSNILIKLSEIQIDTKFENIKKDNLDKLLNNLINFKLEIIDSNSYDKAQICVGGVDISEINLKKMESKLIKNLYITGEVLDVAGDCGGYNLGFAFMSGILAGSGIIDD